MSETWPVSNPTSYVPFIPTVQSSTPQPTTTIVSIFCLVLGSCLSAGVVLVSAIFLIRWCCTIRANLHKSSYKVDRSSTRWRKQNVSTARYFTHQADVGQISTTQQATATQQSSERQDGNQQGNDQLGGDEVDGLMRCQPKPRVASPVKSEGGTCAADPSYNFPSGKDEGDGDYNTLDDLQYGCTMPSKGRNNRYSYHAKQAPAIDNDNLLPMSDMNNVTAQTSFTIDEAYLLPVSSNGSQMDPQATVTNDVEDAYLLPVSHTDNVAAQKSLAVDDAYLLPVSSIGNAMDPQATVTNSVEDAYLLPVSHTDNVIMQTALIADDTYLLPVTDADNDTMQPGSQIDRHIPTGQLSDPDRDHVMYDLAGAYSNDDSSTTNQTAIIVIENNLYHKTLSHPGATGGV